MAFNFMPHMYLLNLLVVGIPLLWFCRWLVDLALPRRWATGVVLVLGSALMVVPLSELYFTHELGFPVRSLASAAESYWQYRPMVLAALEGHHVCEY